jgi:hypothetical protein
VESCVLQVLYDDEFGCEKVQGDRFLYTCMSLRNL